MEDEVKSDDAAFRRWLAGMMLEVEGRYWVSHRTENVVLGCCNRQLFVFFAC